MIKGLFSAALAASVLMLPAMRAQADVHALIGIAGGAIIACGVTGACGNGGGNRSHRGRLNPELWPAMPGQCRIATRAGLFWL